MFFPGIGCTIHLHSGKKWNFQKIRSGDYFVWFQYEFVYIKMAQNCKKSISTIMGKYASAYRNCVQFRCLLHYFKRSVCPFFWEEKVFHNVRSFQKKIGNIYIRIGRGIANQNRLVNNQNAQKCDFFSFKEKNNLRLWP